MRLVTHWWSPPVGTRLIISGLLLRREYPHVNENLPKPSAGRRPSARQNAFVCIVRPSTTRLQSRPHVTRDLVNVFSRPVQ